VINLNFLKISFNWAKTMNITEVVEYSGVRLRKKGKLLTGLCPFHNDKTDGNFFVYEETDSFYCFVCGQGGSKEWYIKIHPNCKSLRNNNEENNHFDSIVAKLHKKVVQSDKQMSNKEILQYYESINKNMRLIDDVLDQYNLKCNGDIFLKDNIFNQVLILKQLFDYYEFEISKQFCCPVSAINYKEIKSLNQNIIKLKNVIIKYQKIK